MFGVEESERCGERGTENGEKVRRKLKNKTVLCKNKIIMDLQKKILQKNLRIGGKDGRMDAWMDGCTDGQMDVRADG